MRSKRLGVAPDENLSVYTTLYNIEVGLRELLIEELAAKAGARWWKQRLPSDVLDSYRRAREYELGIRWTRLVPHHPIYYLDFSDLKKIIERSNNWSDVFAPLFERKDVFVATLSELEPIRNKSAHNRRASESDVSIAQAALQKITSAVGAERFFTLVARNTALDDLPQILTDIREEADLARKRCEACEQIGNLTTWEEASQSWWFDSGYLGHDLTAIIIFFQAISLYSKLPRVRGEAYRIEAWVQSQDIARKHEDATRQLASVLADSEG